MSFYGLTVCKNQCYKSLSKEKQTQGTESMTYAEYEVAKELAETFQLKAYDKEAAATYMIKNHFNYRFAIEVLLNMK